MNKPVSNESKDFSTFDLSLVGALLAKGFSLKTLQRSQNGRALFVMQGDRQLEAAINDFWNFQCSVDAQTYFNRLKNLKNQIYSSR